MVRIESIVLGMNTAKSSNQSPLIMLHGWNRSANDMLPFAKLLEQSLEVHVLDLPGFGKSELPDGDWDTMQYANRIVQYMKDNNISKANLLGHSFGGRVSLRIAAAYPEMVDNLVLMGSHGLKRKRNLKDSLRVKFIPKLGKFLKFLDKTFGVKLYQEKFVPRFASKDYLNAGALRGTLVKTVNEDQTEQVKTIKVPTLLLWGEDDTETPLELGKQFSQLMTNSRLIVMPNKGHDLFQDIDAHLSGYYVLKFLCGPCTTAREACNA